MTAARRPEAPIERVDISAYTVPTDGPEADGTLSWDSTTLVLVEATAGGQTGLGYSYADLGTAKLAQETLAGVVHGCDALDVPRAWDRMVHAIRNLGRPGISSMAVSAVDNALWDLKAKLLGLSLLDLLGAARDAVPIYGSGGFTSYTVERLQAQLAGWVEQGIPRVKMKVGTHPEQDLARVTAAREAIGPAADLYVDANGAYERKEALAFAEHFAELGVSWFEEPVYHHDLDGLRLLRDRAPASLRIAAGEYGYDLWYFRRMLDAGAVDVQQADLTRCGGVTAFLRVGALCESRFLPLSGHTAPMLHAQPACALPAMLNLEYFYDHVRIARLLFDGVLEPVDGTLRPDRSRPGFGLELKRQDAERWRVAL